LTYVSSLVSEDVAQTNHNLTPTDFDQRFQRAFALLAFTVNRHMVDHMRRICVELSLDLETAQIWGTLVHMNMLPNLALGTNPMEVLDELGRNKSITLTAVRLAELTQVTGLPRETVRRKLEHLQALGKTERTDDGKWIHCSAGLTDLEVEFTRKTVQQFLKTAQTLLTILDMVEANKTQSPERKVTDKKA